jgi:hypothetical protein
MLLATLKMSGTCCGVLETDVIVRLSRVQRLSSINFLPKGSVDPGSQAAS